MDPVQFSVVTCYSKAGCLKLLLCCCLLYEGGRDAPRYLFSVVAYCMKEDAGRLRLQLLFREAPVTRRGDLLQRYMLRVTLTCQPLTFSRLTI